ncbi:hypothetical protein [Fusobacterium sp. PH5-44]|uniref:hypothetical protein n=1 Tax=Fusobacterium sp. PH5-44 TaxID=2940518 RepID=UPI003D25CAF6
MQKLIFKLASIDAEYFNRNIFYNAFLIVDKNRLLSLFIIFFTGIVLLTQRRNGKALYITCGTVYFILMFFHYYLRSGMKLPPIKHLYFILRNVLGYLFGLLIFFKSKSIKDYYIK